MVVKNEAFTHLYEVEDGPYTPKEVRGRFQSCTSLLTVLAKASVEGRLKYLKEAME